MTDKKHQAEFDERFYMTLRLLAENGYCALITTSGNSLFDLCKDVLEVSSPFYNIFEEIRLDVFTKNEADEFLNHYHEKKILSSDDVRFIKTNIDLYQHPLILQISCDAIYRNKKNQLDGKSMVKNIKIRYSHLLCHDKIMKGRKKLKKYSDNNKIIDLLVSVLIPVIGIGIIMFEFGFLIEKLNFAKAILLVLATSVIGFALLLFAGRFSEIIGESTFFKLFTKVIDQIPLFSNLADKITEGVGKIKNPVDNDLNNSDTKKKE